MGTPYFLSLPVVLLFGFIAIGPAHASTSGGGSPQLVAPGVTNPQIVRLSYVEGDVRIMRGKGADKLHDADSGVTTGWEKAEANLSLESGYSLVTGIGRAEIELEDASTVYLGDHSVLSLGEITSTGGVPYTDMALLSGTAILNIQITSMGEVLNFSSPTDHFSIRYPDRAYVRVDSFLDAMAVTPQRSLTFHLAAFNESRPLNSGQTFTFSNGRRVMTPAAADVPADSSFDQWVAARVAARGAIMTGLMKEAGLSEPIPGLAEMKGQGAFFACAPYGTCWQPAKGWDGKDDEIAAAVVPPGAAAAALPGAAPVAGKPAAMTPRDAYLASHPGATLFLEDYSFPCSTYGESELVGKDPTTGKETVIETEFNQAPFGASGFLQVGYPLGGAYRGGYGHRFISPFVGFDGYWGVEPWSYGVCHAGSWVRWHHRYAWVAGERRHHRPPVRWVKAGRTVGFVPIHPGDSAGKAPQNLKSGILRFVDKGRLSMDRVDIDPGKPVKLLDEAPKEYRKPALEPLQVAEVPLAYAHSVYAAAAREAKSGSAMPGAAGAAQRPVNVARGTAVVGATPERGTLMTATAKSFASAQQGTPINFDRKSQSFTVARPVMEGGRTTMAVQSLGGGGASYQATGRTMQNSAGYTNNGGATRSYAPPQAYNSGSSSGNASAASRSSAPSYSAPAARPSYSAPAPSYSAPAAAPSASSSSPSHR